MITSIERRGRPRVDVQEVTQVLPEGSHQTIYARAANLSESGMFVASRRLFGVGTEIGVRLMLGAPPEQMSLRGRVVRVSEGKRPGMGIAFEQIGDKESAALRHALEEDGPVGIVREAKGWFAGTAQPTRVLARLDAQGLRLYCDSAFLRLGVPATLFFPDEEDKSYTGTLQTASLQIDPDGRVPRLELAMSLEQLPEAAQTWTYWPPPPVSGAGSDEAGREQAAPLVELAPVAEPEPGAEHHALEIAAPLAEPGPAADQAPGEREVITEAASAQPGEEIFSLTKSRSPVLAEGAMHTVSGAIQARELPSPAMASEPTVQVRSLVPPQPRAEAPLEANADTDWHLGSVDAAAASQWSIETEEVAPARQAQPRRRVPLWLWLLALSMTGLTAASMSYTKLWQRVADKLLAPRPQAQAESLQPEATSAAVPMTSPAPSPPVEAAAESAENSPAAPSQSREAKPPAPAEGSFPAVAPGTATLVIPIEGSLDEARQYLLAKPDGVAVNLPHARPRVRFGDYQVSRGGFRMVWVRRRVQGGLHLRVLHEPGSVPSVELTASSVTVTLKPAALTAPAAGDGATP